MNQHDLYTVLGLAPTASQADIAHAYRVLLRRHHPDTRPAGDQTEQTRSDTALSDVIAAYAVLGDERRRADYDRDIGSRPSPSPHAARHPRAGRSRFISKESPSPPIVAGPVMWQPIRRRGVGGG